MKNPKFQIFIGNNNQFYFRLYAANGEIVLNSEGYTTKSGCKKGIASVKGNALLEERYQRKTSVNGQFYFVLVAANGKVIGVSEMYPVKQNRENGIKTVKKVASDAYVEVLN
jgi:hypothetical protein